MKIILNILTHGDEKIGVLVAQEIQKLHIDKKILTIQTANKKAFDLKKRFIDQDLNRSFPGKRNGNHEERVAYRLSPAIRSADLVIDIHSTKSDLRDAIIVTKLDTKTRRYLDAMQPKYVLVMNATKNSALISQASIGIAFEYGKDDDPQVLKNIVTDLKKLFHHIGIIRDTKLPKRKRATRYFNVIREVKKPKGYRLLNKIKNYKLIRKGETFAAHHLRHLVAEKSFYPILFGNENYDDHFGFMGERMHFDA